MMVEPVNNYTYEQLKVAYNNLVRQFNEQLDRCSDCVECAVDPQAVAERLKLKLADANAEKYVLQLRNTRLETDLAMLQSIIDQMNAEGKFPSGRTNA